LLDISVRLAAQSIGRGEQLTDCLIESLPASRRSSRLLLTPELRPARIPTEPLPLTATEWLAALLTGASYLPNVRLLPCANLVYRHFPTPHPLVALMGACHVRPHTTQNQAQSTGSHSINRSSPQPGQAITAARSAAPGSDLEGESYRKREAEQSQKAKQAQKPQPSPKPKA